MIRVCSFLIALALIVGVVGCGDGVEYDLVVCGGSITRNTTWQGDIFVTGAVTVEPDVTLTILPGTRVKFQHYRGYREPERRLVMGVEGSIVAIGTAAQPIYFTSDAADPQNGDWSMLRLISPTGPAQFHYCVFEFAQQGLNVWQASPEIVRSIFRWNNWEGVYFESYSQNPLWTIARYARTVTMAWLPNNPILSLWIIAKSGTMGQMVSTSTIRQAKCAGRGYTTIMPMGYQ